MTEIFVNMVSIPYWSFSDISTGVDIRYRQSLSLLLKSNPHCVGWGCTETARVDVTYSEAGDWTRDRCILLGTDRADT